MSKKKINVAIIGATGYTGLDLIYLLSDHPKVNIKYLCARKNQGKKITFFDKRIKKDLPKISSSKTINWSDIDLVYLSLPNGEAQIIIKKLYNKYKHLRFIDLSADFRITNPVKYKENYKKTHKAVSLIKDSIYSISEFVQQDIRKYRIIANPGCYPTSIQLPLIPLIKNNLINYKNIVVDSKSGYSGAGKNLEKKFTHKNLYNSTFAYSPKKHRHVIEIDQEIKKLTSKNVSYSFNPHILPTFRGILSSIYVDLKRKVSAKKIKETLDKYYKDNDFIKIQKLNTNLGSGNVINTNNCEISVCETGLKNKIVIFCAIDNLIKGASGQAIQNMNLLYEFDEKIGLK
tara:strand:+ start:13266 stop:14300 length:1035 start_codon:yes stop_codon:yes gene_type:complete